MAKRRLRDWETWRKGEVFRILDFELAGSRNKSPEQLPWRGNIIVENKANKENAPELPVLISVTTVSSGVSSRQLFRSKLTDADSENSETMVWLEAALAFEYITKSS